MIIRWRRCCDEVLYCSVRQHHCDDSGQCDDNRKFALVLGSIGYCYCLRTLLCFELKLKYKAISMVLLRRTRAQIFASIEERNAEYSDLYEYRIA